ncbi:uncharacterized protein [Nicotiana tomentosiformis]|uniref:uncharacterized protein n=1 Tax=Nicotiana tomentosiformis TaxID=4098 RepID=UPI00388CA059
MHKTLQVMSATETEEVELDSYHLKGVACSWFEMWEDSLEEGIPPVRWIEFADAFMDHFMPAETKAAHAAKFLSQKQGSISVWEYHMRFARLSNYDIYMLPTMEARVCRFMQGLSPLVINEAATLALNSYMNYGKMVAFSQATETRKLKNRMECERSNKARSASNFGGSSSGGGGRSAFRGGAPPSRPVSSRGVILGPAKATWDPTRRVGLVGDFSNSEGPHALGMGRCTLGPASWTNPYVKDEAHPANFAATTSAVPLPSRGTPAPTGRGAARGGAQSSGGPNRFYAMKDCQSSKAYLDVVTDIFTDQKSLQYIFKPKELNMRKRRWLELLKDYDIDILYHLGKANVVADILSQKSMGSLAHFQAYQRPMANQVHRLVSLGVHLAYSSDAGVIVQNRAELLLVVEVKETQYNDPLLVQLKGRIHKHKTMDFSLGMDDGTHFGD